MQVTMALQRESREQESVKDGEKDGRSTFAEFLERAKLLKYQARLDEEGYVDMVDLAEAEDDDLAECGLKKPEVKRLRRTLAELAASPEVKRTTNVRQYADLNYLDSIQGSLGDTKPKRCAILPVLHAFKS